MKFRSRKKGKHKTTRTCKGKVRYRDKREAMAALHRLGNYDQRQKTPVRAYACHRCKGWHLTSEQPRGGS
jgi:hypothetical protein